MDNICKNCGVDTEKKYCSSCGQSTHIGRINLHEIVHEFLHGIIHVDTGIFYTIKELSFRPGKIIREYFDGKRVKLFKPFGYFFILATLYVFITHMSGQNIVNIKTYNAHGEIQVDSKTIDVASKNQELKEVVKSVAEAIDKHYSLVMLCTIPFISLVTFAAFRRQKYNYGEHLVMNSYIMGHQVLMRILLIPLEYFFGKTLIDNWGLLVQIILFVYMLGAVFNTYSLWKRILYPLIIQVIMTIIIATAVVTAILFYMFI